MNKESKIHLALVAGLFATGGGVCAKLAGFYEMVDVWNSLAKIILLLTMITSNTLGNTLFVKAMAGSGSSLPATVTSSTVNYFCSALMGFLFFGEKSSIRWWFGTSLVLLGLVLIGYSPAAAPQCSSKEQQRQQQQQLLEKEKEERKRQ